jgi:glucose/arabinose dehydrogenase
LALVSFVSGLTAPLGLEAPNDGTGRLFVVEQGGTIRIIQQNGTLLPTAFLDITSNVESGGEEGLLGLAFHPNFSTNGRFFVNYTHLNGTQLETHISEFTVSANPNLANSSSEIVLLVVDQPFPNHNGGQLAFGPDGYLYIGLGDGGGAGDTLGNGQNLATLLGKILRIDVSTPGAYAIPADNPFTGVGQRREIWAYGLRNPWRFSFDPLTGRLFAGDVGQNNFEEVDLIVKGGNFGWNIMEGNHCYPPGTLSCNMTGLILPLTEYPHNASGGTAIIGGFVYRGSTIPSLVGVYVFGDFTSGHIWGLTEVTQGNWKRKLMLTHHLTVSAFGRDTAGELYLVDIINGAILRLQAGP